MYKKILAFILCIVLSFSIAACGGQDTQGTASNGQQNSDKPEPLLGPDATDEELLELLGDEIHVVQDDDYAQMVKEFQEHTDEHSGKVYQMEGTYMLEGETPYIARTLTDGSEDGVIGLPLKYLLEPPEENSPIRVTGIVNEGEIDGKTVAVLEAIVVEPLEGQGQAKL
ncbi:MAG: hypothetical protein HFI06_11520 [Eubacterium sp.]|jgi:hypothetical protein|nr:hypothetical protein [Eubacterium sp.]NBI88535.1 hypothetical protein [Lachnospiraceae bacterium]